MATGALTRSSSSEFPGNSEAITKGVIFRSQRWPIGFRGLTPGVRSDLVTLVSTLVSRPAVVRELVLTTTFAR